LVDNTVLYLIDDEYICTYRKLIKPSDLDVTNTIRFTKLKSNVKYYFDPTDTINAVTPDTYDYYGSYSLNLENCKGNCTKDTGSGYGITIPGIQYKFANKDICVTPIRDCTNCLDVNGIIAGNESKYTQCKSYKDSRNNIPLNTCTSNLGTCTSEKTTCNSNLGTCTSDKNTCNSNLGTCTSDKNTCNSNLGTCTSNLGTCTSEKNTCNSNLGTCTSRFGTCTNLCRSNLTSLVNTVDKYKQLLRGLNCQYNQSDDSEMMCLNDTVDVNSYHGTWQGGSPFTTPDPGNVYPFYERITNSSLSNNSDDNCSNNINQLSTSIDKYKNILKVLNCRKSGDTTMSCSNNWMNVNSFQAINPRAGPADESVVYPYYNSITNNSCLDYSVDSNPRILKYKQLLRGMGCRNNYLYPGKLHCSATLVDTSTYQGTYSGIPVAPAYESEYAYYDSITNP
jgi:hypothetical protein